MKYLVCSLLILRGVLWAEDESEGQKIIIAPTDIPVGMVGQKAYKEVIASGKYLVGPGDEFVFYVPGMENAAPSRVLAEGVLFVPKVGMVKVGGLRLAAVHKVIEKAFQQNFKVGKMEFALANLRSFPVQVVGMVDRPGIAVATGIERVSDVIAKRGGRGSRRNVRVFNTAHLSPEILEKVHIELRQGSILGLKGLKSQRVDLVMYDFSSNSKYNPYVEDGDIILLTPSQGQITSIGALAKPLSVDYVAGERVSDLIVFSLGLAPSYDSTRTVIFRYEEDDIWRQEIPVDIMGALAGKEQANLLLEPDDWLVVRSKPDYHAPTTVNISGEVVYPGVYIIEEDNTHLSEIIERAGGLTKKASLNNARFMRADVFETEDLVAEHIGTIPVADRTEMDNQYFTMKSRQRPEMIVDFIELVDRGASLEDIILKPGDSIFIPRRTGTVLVSGQVASPGALDFNPDYGITDYVERAGGRTWRAQKNILVIKSHTGEIKQAKKIKKLEPGDRIWIREKPERDYWKLFTDVTQVLGEVSTVVLLFVSLL